MTAILTSREFNFLSDSFQRQCVKSKVKKKKWRWYLVLVHCWIITRMANGTFGAWTQPHTRIIPKYTCDKISIILTKYSVLYLDIYYISFPVILLYIPISSSLCFECYLILYWENVCLRVIINLLYGDRDQEDGRSTDDGFLYYQSITSRWYNFILAKQDSVAEDQFINCITIPERMCLPMNL